MNSKIKVAPSLLSVDFGILRDELEKLEAAGADLLHVDVMDGHFVPNITIGPVVVKYIRKYTKLPLDVHLMISNPQDYFEVFADAGADLLTYHIETTDAPDILADKIRGLGCVPSITLTPGTSLSRIEPVLEKVDKVLVMTVNPGFAGQKFISDMLPKIRQLRKIYDKDIEVDGGINQDTAKLAVEAGANIVVAGSYVFKFEDYKQAINSLRY